MRKILCLALPALLAAACGDAANTEPTKLAAAPDAGEKDAPPASPDVPDRLDLYIAPTNPDVAIDLPLSPDLLAMPIDGPTVKLDAPTPPDGLTWTIEWDVPPKPADGPTGPIDATTRTLRSPDGRTWTVIMVGACYGGRIGSDNRPCTNTYAEGRARATTPPDGSYAPGTAAGRCAEGSYVYAPYRELETMYCFYDATTQNLVGYMSGHDTTYECGTDGTASNVSAYGQIPPCTNITWEISRSLY
jgi:hypothetical protein